MWFYAQKDTQKCIKNVEIKNFNKLILDNNNYLFHAGTKNDNNKILAIGGRVLNFVSLSNDFFEGRKIFTLI